jgi:hypothetical protein
MREGKKVFIFAVPVQIKNGNFFNNKSRKREFMIFTRLLWLYNLALAFLERERESERKY